MAVVRIPEEKRVVDGDEPVASFLAAQGIDYERWVPSHVIDAGAPAAEVLEAYAAEIDRLKARGGYVTADVIDVRPDTPGLDAMLAKFSREHWHDEDEVRFILEGNGVFHVHPRKGPGVRHRGPGRRSDPRAPGHLALVRPLRRSSHPGHSPLPGRGWLDAPVHRERRRSRIRAGMPGARPRALARVIAEPDAVLLDIEGTTTPVDFVTGVLFPYARERVADYLTLHFAEPSYPRRRPWPSHRARTRHREGARAALLGRDAGAVAEYSRWLMDEDRKATALKALQGRIWEEGFRAGELQGALYEDVPRAFEQWRKAGRTLAIFSSGSVLAQKLLFGNTAAGDMTPYLAAYFDTTIGAKREAESYRRIAQALGRAPGSILFVSDVAAELDAAEEAALLTALCVREGPLPSAGAHPVIRSLDELFGQAPSPMNL
jgi:enolase-phosphatase E1